MRQPGFFIIFGVWQDAGILIHFPEIEEEPGHGKWPEQWVAFFLSFQSQGWHTDDATGHRLDHGPTESSIRIIAALVNAEGSDEGRETVTLIKIHPRPLST